LSQTDISLDDFRRIFGADGVLDRFTNDALGPYLDRTRRPWQWRSDEGTDPLQLGPALPSTLQQATEIRRAFELPLTLSLRAGEVDPRIAKVLLRVDGKAFEYLQGPRETIDIPWPGKESSGVHLVLQIAGGGEQRRRWDGQWALFRALSDATLEKGTARGQLHVTFDVGGYRVPILINTNRTIHPLLDNPLEGFRCPPL
jgi:type VI secretion system protein ImpL